MPKHLIHAHSVVVTDGSPKLPDAERIEYGEIAVNYAEGYETLSIKNSNDDVVTFSSDDAIKKIIIDNEKVVANALLDVQKTIQKDIQERIEDNEYVVSNALNELEDKIEDIELDGLDERITINKEAIDELKDTEETLANSIEELDQKIDVNSSVIAQLYNSNKEKVSQIVQVTYSQLKQMRDNGTLLPGQLYRITDYSTLILSQANTQSATHDFDIIVLATSENTLSEDAKAARHEGDTYFAEANLDAWTLKYSLDNDSERFAWANTNGKGVIYYMKDEYNNECPYDFKNIMFKRWNMTNFNFESFSLEDENAHNYIISALDMNVSDYKYLRYCHTDNIGTEYMYGLPFSPDVNNSKFYYTFSVMALDSNMQITDVQEDITVKAINKNRVSEFYYPCVSNIIKPCYDIVNGKNIQVLNNIVFMGAYSIHETMGAIVLSNYMNTIDNDSKNLTFGFGSSYNKIGTNVTNMIFTTNCMENKCNHCKNCTFIDEACYNVMDGLNDYSVFIKGSGNILNMNSTNNIFYMSYANILLEQASLNVFSTSSNNYLGLSVTNCVFNTGCNRNKIFSGENCIFGQYCEKNILMSTYDMFFGDSCSFNKIDYSNLCNFANNCSYNVLEGYTSNITLSKDYTENVTFESGCIVLTLTSSGTTSASNKIDNIRVKSLQRKTISHTLGSPFTTYQANDAVVVNV